MIELMKLKRECGVCSTEIKDVKENKKGRKKLAKNSEYNEIKVPLNNGSNLVVGVCSKHTSLKDTDYVIMGDKAKQGWLEEVALGLGSKEWFEKTGSKLHITGGA